MNNTAEELTPQQIGSSSLLSYVGLQYPKYVAEPAHELMATALEAVEAGNIRRLLINIPPQHGKTLLASEFFPPWVLGRHPDWKIIAATFNQTRANEVGGIVRNNLTNTIHRAVFPNCGISPDTKSTHHVATNDRGHYYSTGIGGTITGRGANCLTGDTEVEIKFPLIETPSIVKLEELETINTEFKILCFDHITKLNIYKPIQAIQKRNVNFIYKIKTENGIILNGTAEHPLYIIPKEKYIELKHLHSGDILFTQYGQKEQIDTIVARKVPQTTVYDIQVEGTNNFFANKILVHNCFIVDDPLKDREDAESKLVREKVKEWYRAVAYTRLRPDNRIIIIQTRWHRDDLSGFVLSEHAHENWTVLDLKAVAEKGDILGRPIDAALCPQMYDEEYLANVKLIEGTYNWESLYQQRPIPKEGGMVQYDWIKHYTELPDERSVLKKVISWDTAYKEDQLSDPTAATVWHLTKNGYYLVDVLNKKLTFPNLVRKVKELHNIHNVSAHLIEGRASGQSLIQELKATTTIPVIEISTKNLEKKVRFDAITGFFESGKVWLPEQAHWRTEVEDQICLFPSTKFDDIVDSVSQFLNWCNKPRYVRRPPSKLYWK